MKLVFHWQWSNTIRRSMIPFSTIIFLIARNFLAKYEKLSSVVIFAAAISPLPYSTSVQNEKGTTCKRKAKFESNLNHKSFMQSET